MTKRTIAKIKSISLFSWGNRLKDRYKNNVEDDIIRKENILY